MMYRSSKHQTAAMRLQNLSLELQRRGRDRGLEGRSRTGCELEVEYAIRGEASQRGGTAVSDAVMARAAAGSRGMLVSLLQRTGMLEVEGYEGAALRDKRSGMPGGQCACCAAAARGYESGIL